MNPKKLLRPHKMINPERIISRFRVKKGLPPGATVFTGKKKVEKIAIHYLEFNEETLTDDLLDNESITNYHEPDETVMQWYDVRGLHDTTMIDDFGKVFKVHPLVLEDIVDVHQRPKFDEYEHGIYLCFRSLLFDEESEEIHTEQLSIYFGQGFLLSFQEQASDTFADVRQRIHNGRGRVRARGSDYLAYALLDAAIDHYFLVIESIEQRIEELEEEISSEPSDRTKSRIHHLKNEMIKVRKAISPLREAIGQFAKSDHEFIADRTQVFVRDAYDHTIQLMDIVETYRDTLSGLQDLYISELSFRMNKVMQVLTIVTTIFVPLSFLAGVYGMNFEHMPELKYRYSYFILLGVMALVGIGALILFKIKKWL